MSHSQTGPRTGVIDRLVAATNAHDLDALVECFADDYVLTNPAHPARSFSGRDQVRRNWETIFAGVPDVSSTVLARAEAPAVGTGRTTTVWLDMTMTGTRRDGSPHEMAGVMVFGVRDEAIVTGRFFLEPVDRSSGGGDAAVRAAVADPVR